MKEQNCMSHFFHRRSGSAAVFSFSVMSPRRGSIRRARNGKIVSYDKGSTMKVLNRLSIALTVAGLATTLVPVSAHAARNLAFDDKDNLFVADTDSILKFTPDGKKSTFASEVSPYKMAVDGAGNLFVTQDVSSNLFVKGTSAPRSLNSRPKERKARSPPGLALTKWPLTEWAISLRRMVTRSSNSHPMERRAPSPPGSTPATWSLTVRAISL